MAPRKTTPRAKPTPGLEAAQKALGLIKNSQGAWVKPNAAQAADYMARVVQRGGYANDPSYPSTSTPFGTKSGVRIGTYDQSTGVFSLAGRAPGAGPKKGLGAKAQTRKRRGKGAAGTAGGGLDEPLAQSPYAENDLSTTSYLRTQGKAYAAGREGMAGSRAGATSAGEEAKPRTKTRKKKGLLKTRGQRQKSGVKPAFHINKQGKVVPNKGGRKARPKTK